MTPNPFVRHFLWPIASAAAFAVLTHISQGGAFTLQSLAIDAAGAAAGVLATLMDPKGGEDRPWLVK